MNHKNMCTQMARLHVGKTPEKNQDASTMKVRKVKALVFQNQEISSRGHTHAIVHVSMHTFKHAYVCINTYMQERMHTYVHT